MSEFKMSYILDSMLISYNETVEDLPLHIRPEDFSRRRIFTVDSLAHCILTMGGKSLQSELNENYRSFDNSRNSFLKKKTNKIKCHISAQSPTKSAFSKSRQRLGSWFFADFFNRFVDKTMKYRSLYKGRILAALDGTDITYQTDNSNPDTIVHFDNGVTHSLLHVEALCDLKTRAFIGLDVNGKRKADEQAQGIGLVEACGIKNMIVLGDRYYDGSNFLAHMQEADVEYLVRGKDITSNGFASGFVYPETNEFDVDICCNLTNKESKETKALCEADPNSYRIVDSRSLDYLPPTSRSSAPQFYTLKTRIVRIEIAPNEYETLYTNLDRKEFPASASKELYHRRWGIETAFRDLKHTIALKGVHSRLTDLVKQEIYARAIMYNFVQFLAICAERKAKHRKTNKWKYKINIHSAASAARRFFLGFITIEQAVKEALKNPVPIRENRSAPRRMDEKPNGRGYRPA